MAKKNVVDTEARSRNTALEQAVSQIENSMEKAQLCVWDCQSPDRHSGDLHRFPSLDLALGVGASQGQNNRNLWA